MTLPADIDAFLDPILKAFETSLTASVQGHLVTGYLKGSAEMLEWGRTKTTDMPIYYEGPPMGQAMDYAQKHTATLVKGLNAETREQMRGVIQKAIINKRGIPGLSRDLRSQFSNMSRARSKVIARTETCDALENAFMDRAKDMKVTGKEWVVSDPCDICAANGDAGPILMDKAFPSGDMRPPAHPNCRCALAPVMLTDKGERPTAGTIEKAEQEFGAQFGNSKKEFGRGIDAAGREMLTKSGTSHSVRYSSSEMARLANAKSFIHNHPSGGTFSPDDIMFAKSINTGKMMAIDKVYKYTASPVETWLDVGRFSVTYRREMNMAVTQIRAALKANPDMGAKAANVLLQDKIHHIMAELAPKYGIKYTRELL